jgi:kynurenine formamidase
MKLTDVTVPLDAALPVYPGHTPFSLEAVSGRAIAPEALKDIDAEDIGVLIKTRNSRLRRLPQFDHDYVSVTAEGTTYLVNHGVKVPGVDYLSVGEFHKPVVPAHTILHGGRRIVIEGLNLGDVEPGTYELLRFSLRIVDADAAPARAVLPQS